MAKSLWVRMTDNAWFNMDNSYRRVEINKSEGLRKPNKYILVAPKTIKLFKTKDSAVKFAKSWMRRH